MGPAAIAALALLAISCQGYPSLKVFAFTLWVLTATVAALFYPAAFLSWGGFQLSRLNVPLIQLIMFGMGASLSFSDFARAQNAQGRADRNVLAVHNHAAGGMGDCQCAGIRSGGRRGRDFDRLVFGRRGVERDGLPGAGQCRPLGDDDGVFDPGGSPDDASGDEDPGGAADPDSFRGHDDLNYQSRHLTHRRRTDRQQVAARPAPVAGSFAPRGIDGGDLLHPRDHRRQLAGQAAHSWIRADRRRHHSQFDRVCFGLSRSADGWAERDRQPYGRLRGGDAERRQRRTSASARTSQRSSVFARNRQSKNCCSTARSMHSTRSPSEFCAIRNRNWTAEAPRIGCRTASVKTAEKRPC